MTLLDNLEKKLSGFCFQNLTLFLMLGQILFFIVFQFNMIRPSELALIPDLVLSGEWYRIITFCFMPITDSLIFAAFAWYVFYMMGTHLEQHFGRFRYHLYLLSGFIFTLIASLYLNQVPYGTFLYTWVFLAFAILNPNVEFRLFFILPVKVKWLSALYWLGFLLYFIAVATLPEKVMLMAQLANFFLFFTKDITTHFKDDLLKTKKTYSYTQKKAFHECYLCGVTDQTDSQMEFRYCQDCQPTLCYCKGHLGSHEHVY